MLESKMSAKLKQLLPHIMFQNIETGVSLGVPDIIYAHKDIQGWIELKELSRVPKAQFTVPWRPGQLAWYKNYVNKYKVDCPYFLILTIKESWYIIVDIKEHYAMEEIKDCYVGETKQLNKKQIEQILLKELPWY